MWNLIIQIKKNSCLFKTAELHRGSLELRKMMHQQGRALIFHENCTAQSARGGGGVTLETHWLCGGLWRRISGTSAQIAFVLMYQWQRFYVCPPGPGRPTRPQHVSWQCLIRGGFYEWFHNTLSQWKFTNYAERTGMQTTSYRAGVIFLMLPSMHAVFLI